MGDTAEKDDPELWETVKKEITEGDKGGKPGQWSARKAQLASSEYQKRGGGYEGEKSDDNSLQEWTEEDWGTKSGKKSEDTGERYLPKDAREELSDEEYKRTSDKKRDDTKKGKQHSEQPDDIAEKTAKHRDGGEPTKEELYEAAQEADIDGRSKMSKDELQQALADADGKKGSDEGDGEATKEELYEKAQEQDVDGRSKMSKGELKQAVKSEGDEGDGEHEPTKEELYERAQERNIEGRSKMSKEELKKALGD